MLITQPWIGTKQCACGVWKRYQGQTSGKGLHIKLDESLFSKQKNVRGMPPEQWIFSGVYREPNKCFLVDMLIVLSCFNGANQAVCQEKILYAVSHIHIMSKLENKGFLHFHMNHAYNSLIHIRSLKWWNKKH